jgi:ribonuclease III
MLRFLKLFVRPRTSSKPLATPSSDQHQGEERVVLSASPTLDKHEFTRRTGYRIHSERHFLQAVIHRSFLQMCSPGITQSNERMEFLGDAVLNLIVAEYLYQVFPEAEEGDLSKVRSRLVSRSALAECARQLQLEDFLLMSPSAHQSIRSGSESILVDAVEAFVAAIYLDGGYHAAKTFIYDHLINAVSPARMTQDENYKSKLLEFSQGRGMGIPKYVLIDEAGPDHSPIFTVEVQVAGVPVGSGKGGNKKTAEQMAAANAIEHFKTQENAGTQG